MIRLRKVGARYNHSDEREGLRAGLILWALIDDLTVVHVELVHINSLPAWSGGDMQMLDPV
jgi:hypothetical protein